MAGILIVHDQSFNRRSLAEALRREGHSVCQAERPEHGPAEYPDASGGCDVVIIGGSCSQGAAGLGALEQFKARWPGAEVIILGDATDVRSAVDAMRLGAYDVLPRSVERETLLRTIAAAARKRPLARPAARSHGTQDEAIAADPAMRAIFAKADRVAAVNSTVLITGESGTGKDVLARRLHRNSSRSRGKFVPVNCGSLPETLIETELFGYRRGAFTGAVSNTKGLIEEASGGTLFLDEIGDMPTAMQVRLLRFLDGGEVRAVGDTVVRHVDVRVIAATNRCLVSDVEEGRFRRDLFYRLSVISLHLPPLRERPGDILPLVELYLGRASARLGRPVPVLSSDVQLLLEQHDWPGNVRELQNVVEQALVQAADDVITRDDLPASVTAGPASPRKPFELRLGGDHPVTAALEQCGGDKRKAAAALGISRTTLWRRLRSVERIGA